MTATFTKLDLQYLLTQIQMAETNTPPVSPHLAFGLREVAGTNNNDVPGQGTFGSADQTIPTMTQQYFQTVIVNGQQYTYSTTVPGPAQAFGVNVVDPAPRIISNLISDISLNNPAAVQAAKDFAAQLGDGYTQFSSNPTGLILPGADGVFGTADDAWGAGKDGIAGNADDLWGVDGLLGIDAGVDGVLGTADDIVGPGAADNLSAPDLANLFIGNITPDAGLSAPFNSWMTFFGQFFDHGLDLITKGNQGTVMIPLMPDDPLIAGADGLFNTADDLSQNLRFMALTRATNETVKAGADNIIGTSDDIHLGINTTTPFVDQNQTYTSHPSHQFFLREYAVGVDGKVHSTGQLLQHENADHTFSGMATWADVKANALKFGLVLEDKNVGNVPVILTDAYGNYVPDAQGHAQLSMIVNGNVVAVSLDPATPRTLDQIATDHSGTVQFTDHAFINDMAATASPWSHTGALLAADIDTDAGNSVDAAHYDNELLDAHYIAGDGRANENIALTTVHAVFHDEHNRLVQQIKDMVKAELANGDTAFATQWTLAGTNFADGIQENEWNGERIFQAAKFGTETQYQHLVFEEFARKVAPTLPLFGNVDITLNPAITSEFANAVYRFGHSMLDENVAMFQLNADGSMKIGADGQPIMTDMGLIEAFTNPLAYAALDATTLAGADGVLGTADDVSGIASVVQGNTHQIGSEIDEFVTGALRNNLLGLPLDLAALNIARGRDTGVPPINLVRAQIYNATNDQTLKPYDNWAEFGSFLKHPASLINFVAAYGQHASITAATTAADKRVAALNLVNLGLNPAGQNVADNPLTLTVDEHAVSLDAYNFMHSLGDYANNTRSAGADAKLNTADDIWVGGVHAANALSNIGADGVLGTADDRATMWATGSVTGVDNIDLWIGGLAEKQNLFGGLLGSTFNFIFETQLLNLQNGDRLYYLPRIEGMDWGMQIENNTFASMITANTGAKHLPASIFLTPEYTVEAGNYFLKNLDGSFQLDANNHRIATDQSTWLRNPVTGALLVEVLPDGTVHFIGDDNFFGNTMVLGGTDGNDRLVAGHADDDTVWGDGGNDFIDGGNGNDQLFGGTGDDTIVDSAGLDIIHGEDGNDWINGGIDDDIIFGGNGNDYIETGGANLGDEAQGGAGNDVLIGGNGDDTLIGQEGDDWLEGGTGGDGLVGDTGAPTGQVPLYAGNDVLDGGAGGDKMTGFSGDDIMLGAGGFDKFNGLLGFDWADFEKEVNGVSVDMERREFIPNQLQPAGGAVHDFFVETEALGGSKFDDFIQGTENSGGAGGVFNELTNVDLIFNLNTFFKNGVAANFAPDSIATAAVNPLGLNPLGFNNGNILLGGDGSDVITGRGGNDIIDGDAWLHVDLIGRGTANPQIIREIRWDVTDGDIDTAVYRDISSHYIISAMDADGFYTVSHTSSIPAQGGLFVSDGIDHVRNIERLQFADITIALGDGAVNNALPSGTIVITDDDGNPATPVNAVVGAPLVAVSTVTDADGIVPGSIHYTWQQQLITAGGGLTWVDITNTDSLTFTPTNTQLGNALRVVESYVDGKGFHESVSSIPTALLAPNLAVNTAPFVNPQQNPPGLPDTSARTGTPINLFLPITTTFGDHETNVGSLIYAAKLANGAALSTVGLTFTTVTDPATGLITGANITGVLNTVGTVGITVTATDAGTPGVPGTALSVNDTFLINVLPSGGAPVFADALAQQVVGTEDVTVTGMVTAATDPNGDPIAYKVVNGSAVNGSVTVGNNGAFTFIPSLDFAGVASFRYYAFDGLLKSVEKTVNITLAAANDGDAPVTLTGSAALNKVLTAMIGVDPDGPWNPDTASYQWKRDGVDIAPPVVGNADHVVTAADVGHSISVVATYTDGQGFTKSIATDGVVIGSVGFDAVNGLVNSATLSSTSTIQDPDGVDLFSVQTDWAIAPQVADANFGFVPGAFSAAAGNADGTLTLAAGTVRFVQATSSFIDGMGNFETNDSSPIRVSVGTAGADTLTGIAGADIFFGLGGIDTISTGGGDDILVGGQGDDILNGGIGNDTFLYTMGDGADTVTGGTGTDKLVISGVTAAVGIASNDTLDVVTVGGVITRIETGTLSSIEQVSADLAGNTVGTGDTLSYGSNLVAEGVVVDLTAGAATGFTSIANIENVTGGAGNDRLKGDSNRNVLIGGTGNDTFVVTAGGDSYNGTSGTDTLDFSGILSGVSINLTSPNGSASGIDVGSSTFTNMDAIIGGGGNDTYVVSSANGLNIVTETATGGTDTVQSSVNFTLGANYENLTLTGNTAINGTGNTGANTITGNTGANTLNGGGGLGDVLVGGNGSDTYVVSVAGTIVTEANATAATGGTDTVLSSVDFTLGANIENLTMTAAALTGTGNGLGNTLTFFNGTGTIFGGDGNDTYIVSNVGNVATETSATGGLDLVQSSVSYTLGANLDSLTLTGNTAINGTGNELNNIITGNSGANVLTGGDGSDLLIGGGGADTFIGGAGIDNITVSTGSNDNVRQTIQIANQTDYATGHDVITNFDANGAAADRLQFTGALNSLFNDRTIDTAIQFASGNTGGGTVNANMDTAFEALFLSGTNGEGVTAANIGNAAAVALAFNNEFNITAAVGEDGLLVINDTTNGSNLTSVWEWHQLSGVGQTAEIDANELTHIATITSNVTTIITDFNFGP